MFDPSSLRDRTWRLDRRRAVVGILAIVWLLTGNTTPACAQSHLLAPYYWKQRQFFVPYQLNQQNASLRSVAKVQLLLSRDGMSDWRVLEQAEPNVQGFTYLAPEDGEYWFALRHLDQRGRPWPSEAVQPQMRIVVDTELPELDLTGALNATGAVVVRYEARDANLRPETLVIEVRPSGRTWLPLAPGPPDISHANRLVGRAEWNAPFSTSTVEIRGSIADAAGHRAQAHAEFTLSGPTLSQPGAALAQVPVPNQRVQPPGGSAPLTASADPFQQASSATAQEWPTNNRLPPQIVAGSDSVNLFTAPNHHQPPVSNPYSAFAPADSSKRTPARLIGEYASETAPTRQPGQVPGNDQVAPNNWSPPELTPDKNSTRVVNSRTFDVEYDLQSIGPWGVAKVELWGTHDGGATWQSFGVDDDNRSPVRATVPTTGIYGFRILVDGANGAAALPPRSGDVPELVVAVDLDPPSAELVSADVGEGNLSGHLLIRWQVTDTNLEPRPINLFYSSYPNGPWSTIAAGLENTGEYAWRLERHVPDRFYLRLEARDVAGNLGTHQTAEPIMLNRPQPTGRLRGVRPVESNSRRYNTAENGR